MSIAQVKKMVCIKINFDTGHFFMSYITLRVGLEAQTIAKIK